MIADSRGRETMLLAEIARLRAALEEIRSHWDGYVLKDLSAADVMGIVKRAQEGK